MLLAALNLIFAIDERRIKQLIDVVQKMVGQKFGLLKFVLILS